MKRIFRYIANNFKRLIKISIYINLLLIVVAYAVVEISALKRTYTDVSELPNNEVGLILGTSKYSVKGGINPFFSNRIKAAAVLYHSGKIKYIIVSGDNSHISYNEPIAMKNALLKYGVPSKAIFLDYAGFRTLDSVVRCNKIFGQNSFTVISQRFQNERAIYIARAKGIKVVGFNANGVGFRTGFKTQMRETLARVKMILDIHILKKQPRFLGQEVVVCE